MAKKTLGIDIGTHSLKLALCGGGQVEQLIVVEMPEDLCRAGVISSYDAMADFLKETLKEHKLKVKDAALVLPSAHTFLRRLNLPFMSEQQLKINLPYEFRDFLTLSSDKYYFDYSVTEVLKAEDGTPNGLNLVAAAIQKAVIADYRAMLKRAGLDLKTALPLEMAYSSLISHLSSVGTSEFGILDLGHLGSRLDVFSGSEFVSSRAIETGLVELDRTISYDQFVDIHIAHSFKESNHNDCLNLPAAKNLYSSIAVEVRKAINFFNFSNQGSSLTNLYLCGGGVVINGLVEAIRSQMTEIELHSIQELCPLVNGSFAEISAAAAAIGAAL